MAMCVQIGFAKPLSSEERLRLFMALAPLAKTERLRIVDGGHRVIVHAEALGTARVRRALQGQDLAPESLTTSLCADEDVLVDEP